MGRDEMRAGDGDRKAVADRLKTALDEGRLDLSEYDERLQKTYAAKTFGDLNGLLDDLPGTLPVQHSQVQAYQAPAAPAAGPVQAGEEHDSHRLAWLAPGLGLFLVCTLIWAIGGRGYFWPVWTLIPFVFGLLGTLSGGGSKNRNRNRDRDRRRDR
jgi:hypothetical protein